MSTDLRTALADRLDAVVAPPGDLAAAMRDGHRIRRRRRSAVGSGLAVVLALAGLVGVQLADGPDVRVDEALTADQPVSIAAEGLRAFADPGIEVHYGGRTESAEDLGGLDTDGAATSAGIVFYDDGRPLLLRLDGKVSELVAGPVESESDFRPTAKADPSSTLVAVGVLKDGQPVLMAVDVRTGAVDDRVTYPCDGCEVVIEAFDDGVVFYRAGDGTKAWDVARGTTAQIAGPDTRIVDVRNGVVLYEGVEPDPEEVAGLPDYRFVPGAIDSQLTHDGRHVLAWSSTLQPTSEDGRPLQLAVTEKDGATHWTIDTDGSVLVAVRDGAATRIHDCVPETRACELVRELEITGGDVMFMGNDM